MNTAGRLAEIKKEFSKESIDGFKGKSGKYYRLFYSSSFNLCYYLTNRSNRKGFVLTDADVEDFDSYVYVDKEADLKSEYAIINKYRKEAEKNPYTNPWIELCLGLPNTYERWKKQGKKSLEYFGVISGTVKAGDVISKSVLENTVPFEISQFFKNYEADKEFTGKWAPFKSRTLHFRTTLNPDGSIYGELIVREAGEKDKCYRLINNDKFIIYSN